MLKDAEVGAKTGDLARRHEASEATIFNWKAKYGGLEVPEAQRWWALCRFYIGFPSISYEPSLLVYKPVGGNSGVC